MHKEAVIAVLLIITTVCSCSQKGGSGLSIDSELASCGYNGITVKVGVQADLSWEASSSEETVMIAPSSYTGSCRVSITVPPSSLKQDRDVLVWFRSVGEPSREACFTIRQDAAPYLDFDRDTLEVPYDGGLYSVSVSSNMAWELFNKTIVEEAMVNHIGMSPVEAEGDAAIEITVPRNPRTRQRTMTPILVMKDAPFLRDTLVIIQSK